VWTSKSITSPQAFGRAHHDQAHDVVLVQVVFITSQHNAHNGYLFILGLIMQFIGSCLTPAPLIVLGEGRSDFIKICGGCKMLHFGSFMFGKSDLPLTFWF